VAWPACCPARSYLGTAVTLALTMAFLLEAQTPKDETQ
jgi:hypothetical protein